MIKLIGMGVSILGVVIFGVGVFGFQNIPAGVIGALFFVIGMVSVIKG